MGAAILGLQGTVGSLVGKTLASAASGGYGVRGMALPPVAFDIFSVQATANIILAHWCGIVFSNWLLRVSQKLWGGSLVYTSQPLFLTRLPGGQRGREGAQGTAIWMPASNAQLFQNPPQVLNGFVRKEEERAAAFAPSAPPMPGY